MNSKQLAALIMLGAVWGGSFLFIRYAVGTFGPFLLMVMRVSMAGVLLVLYATVSKQWTPGILRQNWRKFLVIGALNSAIPFSLIGFSQLHITASLGAILNSTTTLFTALLTALWLNERFSSSKWLGLLAGVVGVAILVGWSPLDMSLTLMLAIGAALVAAISYAVAGIYSARAFKSIPSLSVAVGQQLGATALLMPLGVANVPSDLNPSLTVMLAVLGLATVSTALAYILYFYLIDAVGPTKTLSVAYLMPVFGTIWGVVFLHETLNAGMLFGLAMILVSIMLVNEVSISVRPWSVNPAARSVKEI